MREERVLVRAAVLAIAARLLKGSARLLMTLRSRRLRKEELHPTPCSKQQRAHLARSNARGGGGGVFAFLGSIVLFSKVDFFLGSRKGAKCV